MDLPEHICENVKEIRKYQKKSKNSKKKEAEKKMWLWIRAARVCDTDISRFLWQGYSPSFVFCNVRKVGAPILSQNCLRHVLGGPLEEWMKASLVSHVFLTEICT